MSEPTNREWRRSETRVVRPFVGTKGISEALDGSLIRLKSGDAFIEAESIKVAVSEVGSLDISVKVNLNPESLAALSPSEKKSLNCVVLLESGFLKRTEILEVRDLSDAKSFELDVAPELTRRLRAGFSTTLSLALYLNEEREKSPGKPFHKGHWLAKKTFNLDVEKESVAFSIEPLDEAVRKRFSLPSGTLYFINYIGGLNEVVQPDSPPARVYVAKEVIDRLTLSSQQKNAATVESFLTAELTAAIVIRAFDEMDAEEAVTPGSPLASVLKRLKDGFGADESAIRRWATENDGLTLRGYLHSDSQTVRNILAN